MPADVVSMGSVSALRKMWDWWQVISTLGDVFCGSGKISPVAWFSRADRATCKQIAVSTGMVPSALT
jgi:hypothetical protein